MIKPRHPPPPAPKKHAPKYRDNIRIRLQRLNLNTNAIDLALYHPELILLTTLIIHYNRRVIANMLLLGIHVIASQRHHGRNVVHHLDNAIEPQERELTCTPVRFRTEFNRKIIFIKVNLKLECLFYQNIYILFHLILYS